MDDIRSAKPLCNYVSLQRGNTYKSALLGQEGPVLLGLASISRNGGFRSDKLKTYGGPSDERMLLEPGDIYVSLKDVTQSADLLGAVARVPNTIPQGRLTQDTVKLIFKNEKIPKNIHLLATENSAIPSILQSTCDGDNQPRPSP